jgi:hypothetical protein
MEFLAVKLAMRLNRPGEGCSNGSAIGN